MFGQWFFSCIDYNKLTLNLSTGAAPAESEQYLNSPPVSSHHVFSSVYELFTSFPPGLFGYTELRLCQCFSRLKKIYLRCVPFNHKTNFIWEHCEDCEGTKSSGWFCRNLFSKNRFTSNLRGILSSDCQLRAAQCHILTLVVSSCIHIGQQVRGWLCKDKTSDKTEQTGQEYIEYIEYILFFLKILLLSLEVLKLWYIFALCASCFHRRVTLCLRLTLSYLCYFWLSFYNYCISYWTDSVFW